MAEPSPGVYLVELFDWVAGGSSAQMLVPIDDMFEWRFYDNAKWMQYAYEYGGVKQQWERERGDAQQRS